MPPQAKVHRVKYVGPRGRLPAEELHGLEESTGRFGRRRSSPDASSSRTSSSAGADCDPGGSPHRSRRGDRRRCDDFAAGVAQPDRRGGEAGDRRALGRRPARLDRGQSRPAGRPARGADERAGPGARREARGGSRRRGRHGLGRDLEEMRELGAQRVETIPNGCDFDDFEGLEYHPGEKFRITHTGTFFGHRDPRPFLSALAKPKTMSSRASSAACARRIASSRMSSGSASASRRSRTCRVVRRSSCSATRRRSSCSFRMRWAREDGSVREDLRVPRRRAADSRRRAHRRGRRRARAPRPRRSRRRAGRRRCADCRHRGSPSPLEEGRARERQPPRRAQGPAVAPGPVSGVRRLVAGLA